MTVGPAAWVRACMRRNASADDGPNLTPLERQMLDRIEVHLRRDTDLDRLLTPRRVRPIRSSPMPLWAQCAMAALGLALMTAGLLGGPMILAAPGFLALVHATSGFLARTTLSPATFGLERPANAPRTGDDSIAN